MFDLELYKPVSNFSNVEDHVLKIWFGSKITYFIRIIEGCEIKYDLENYPLNIFYFKDGKYVMEYSMFEKFLWINISIFDSYPEIKKEYETTFYRDDNIFYDFIINYFKFELKQLASVNSYSSKPSIRFNNNLVSHTSTSGDNYIKLIELHFNEI